MRVISGIARGRKLETPRGDDIRPTSDKVKEAVFSIIQFETEGRRVLDLFSGTGQMGIEALSRGAAECVFVDSSADSLKLTRRNIETVGFGDVSEIVRSGAVEYIERAKPFDIIFADPPYETDLLSEVMQKIIEFDILKDRGIIICESRTDCVLPQVTAPYRMRREYTYGKIKISIYTKEIDV